MAKSTRSKAKRTFRRVKREDGVFAATHAARLERLNQKLATIARTDKPRTKTDGEEMTEEQGWRLFALLGLMDPDEIEGLVWGESPVNSKCSPNRPRCTVEQSDDNAWLRNIATIAWG